MKNKVRDEREREKEKLALVTRKSYVRASTNAKLINDEKKILRFFLGISS